MMTRTEVAALIWNQISDSRNVELNIARSGRDLTPRDRQEIGEIGDRLRRWSPQRFRVGSHTYERGSDSVSISGPAFDFFYRGSHAVNVAIAACDAFYDGLVVKMNQKVEG